MSRESGYHISTQQYFQRSAPSSALLTLQHITRSHRRSNSGLYQYALTEHSITIDELMREVSSMAWSGHVSHPSVARFPKEFRGAPHRSEQTRSVDELCPQVLRWFVAAEAENLSVRLGGGGYSYGLKVAMGGGEGFIRATSFVEYLIERGLLSSDLVRRHLVKPLIAHHYEDQDDVQRSVRAIALKRREEEQRNNVGVQEPKGEGKNCTMVAKVPAEVETPTTFVSQSLPPATINVPSPIL